jgi:beta-mannosidase
MKYIQQTFLYPKDFESLVYTSQLLQAEAIRYGVEYWRSIRNCCMGTIIWSLNDCWPVISWASIDYYGRWKALHYAAKRFFAPVLLNALKPVRYNLSDINASASFGKERGVIFNVTNIPAKVDCEIIWSHRYIDSQNRHQGKINCPLSRLSQPNNG